MKKLLTTLLCVLLIAAMAVALFACNKGGDPAGEDVLPTASEIFAKVYADLNAGNYTSQASSVYINGDFSETGNYLYKKAGGFFDSSNRCTITPCADADPVTSHYEGYLRQGSEAGKIQLYSKQVSDISAYPEFSLWNDLYTEGGEDGIYDKQPEEDFEKDPVDMAAVKNFGKLTLIEKMGEAFVVTKVDGGYKVALSIDVKAALTALFDADQSVVKWANGLLSVLKVNMTVEDAVAEVKSFLADDMTYGALKGKIEELMKKIDTNYDFSSFIWLMKDRIDAFETASDLYGYLTTGEIGINWPTPKDDIVDEPEGEPRVETVDEYIARVFEELKDTTVSSTISSPYGIKSFAALIDMYYDDLAMQNAASVASKVFSYISKYLGIPPLNLGGGKFLSENYFLAFGEVFIDMISSASYAFEITVDSSYKLKTWDTSLKVDFSKEGMYDYLIGEGFKLVPMDSEQEITESMLEYNAALDNKVADLIYVVYSSGPAKYEQTIKEVYSNIGTTVLADISGFHSQLVEYE